MSAAPPLDLTQFEGFTPGPWAVNGSFAGHPTITSAHNGPVPIYTIYRTDAFDGEDSDTKERRAFLAPNAALIAAAPSLLAECQRLRAENESMRLAGRELAADLDAAESLIYDAYENLADEDELRAAIRERREEKAELATYLKNLPEVTEAKHE